MQAITNKQFLALQKDYLETRTEKAFSALYRLILAYCLYAVDCKLRKARKYKRDDAERIANDSATQFSEMYLKDPAWKCRYFKTRINVDIASVMYQKRPNHLRGICPDRYFYQNNIPLARVTSEPGAVIMQEKCSAIETDDVIQNRDVMKAVYFAKNRKAFIEEVERIEGMSYVKRNIHALLEVYRLTRGPYGKTQRGNTKSRSISKDTRRLEQMVQGALLRDETVPRGNPRAVTILV